MMPKKSKLFSLSLNPLPHQKTKKHAYLASQTTYIETWKTDKTFEDLIRKRESDHILFI